MNAGPAPGQGRWRWAGAVLLGALLLGMIEPALFALSPQTSALLAKSKAALQAKNALAARTFFLQAKAIEPTDPDLLAFERELQEQIEQAAGEHLKLAKFYAASDPPRALAEFRAVLQLIPEHPEAKAGLQAMKEVIKTVEKFREQGIVIDARSGRSYEVAALSALDLFNRAKSAFNQRNLEVAMDLVTQALERDKTLRQALDLRDQIVAEKQRRDLLLAADLDHDRGDYERAVEHYSAFLRSVPQAWDVIFLRGRAALRTGRFRLAAQDFTALLAAWPQVQRWLSSLQRQDEELRRGTATRARGELPKILTRLNILQGLTEALVGQKAFWQAAAVGREAGQSSAFVWRCLGKAFPGQFLLMAMMGIIGLFVTHWTIQMLDGLMSEIPWSIGKEMGRLLWRGWTGLIEAEEERLVALCRRWSHPWLAYLTAMVLLHNHKPAEAVPYFQTALAAPSLAPWAFFFLGLARQSLQQGLGEYDFEQAFLCGMKPLLRPWRPGFLRTLESAILSRFSLERSAAGTCDMRTLAHLLLQNL